MKYGELEKTEKIRLNKFIARRIKLCKPKESTMYDLEKEYKIDEVTAKRLYRVVEAKIIKSVKKYSEKALIANTGALEALFQECLEEGKTKECIEIVKELNRMNKVYDTSLTVKNEFVFKLGDNDNDDEE